MLINLSKVLSQDGNKEKHSVNVDLDSFKSRLGEFIFESKSPVEITIENLGNQVLKIEGIGRQVLQIPCARCLEPVAHTFDIQFEERVDMKLSEEERSAQLEDSNFFEGKMLDVDQLVYNEILIKWPIQVLCKDDCKGICSRCGANHNFTACDCDTTELDPRMAAISDIFSKFKEV